MAKKGKLQGFEMVGDLQRPQRIKKYKYLYLIVCEDENTERVYFQSFENRIPKETIYLKAVGTGLDPLGVVEKAKKEKAELTALRGKDVDAVWVVFDKDDADKNEARIARFKIAFDMITDEKFKYAFSNEVFELWLLLHLKDVDPDVPLPRATVYEELQRLIRTHEGYEDFDYVHGNASILKVIANVGDEQSALERADRLIMGQYGRPHIDANPVTYVGELVKDLHSWIDYYAYQG